MCIVYVWTTGLSSKIQLASGCPSATLYIHHFIVRLGIFHSGHVHVQSYSVYIYILYCIMLFLIGHFVLRWDIPAINIINPLDQGLYEMILYRWSIDVIAMCSMCWISKTFNATKYPKVGKIVWVLVKTFFIYHIPLLKPVEYYNSKIGSIWFHW